MRYLSVCSGIEAASVAWAPLGWTAVAFAEIEPFPSAVLAYRFPGVPNLGDMTMLRDRVLTREIEAADILVGGCPCQSFSIAGLRKSLSDERGNLTLEFVRLANAIDDIRRSDRRDPAFILFENVPGILNTGDNAFGTFLAGLVGSDAPLVPPNGAGWTDAGVVAGPERCAAWRCLDAQHFGLAQRRKRVFVLARRHPRGWACADALLPVIESVRWHSPPRRQAGQRAAPTLAARTRGGGGLGTDFDCDGGLIAYGGNNTSGPIDIATAVNAHGGPHGRLDFESETFIAHSLRADGFDASEDGTGRGTPIIQILEVGKGSSSRGAGPNGAGFGKDGDPMFTLQAGAQHAIAFSSKDHGADAGDIAPTLRAMGHSSSHANAGGQLAVAFAENSRAELRLEGGDGQTTGSLKTGGGKPGQSYPVAQVGMSVRRLLPTECGVLQGFPRNWTLVPYRGKPAADGPRYKSLGNSFAVPVVAWIGRRIQMVEEALSR